MSSIANLSANFNPFISLYLQEAQKMFDDKIYEYA